MKDEDKLPKNMVAGALHVIEHGEQSTLEVSFRPGTGEGDVEKILSVLKENLDDPAWIARQATRQAMAEMMRATEAEADDAPEDEESEGEGDSV